MSVHGLMGNCDTVLDGGHRLACLSRQKLCFCHVVSIIQPFPLVLVASCPFPASDLRVVITLPPQATAYAACGFAIFTPLSINPPTIAQ